MNERLFQDCIDAFTIDRAALAHIAAAFRRDIDLGLDDPGASSLRLLKSYADLPDGDETGEFLALDFGGTNVRAVRIALLGNGRYETRAKAAKPLRAPGAYDLTAADACAEALFDFLARLIGEVAAPGQSCLLGHTFSFPSVQSNLYDARLVSWTKEFATPGVEGEIVNDLLTCALRRCGLSGIRPVAVINDTVATLLAAAYQTPDTRIGSICGTGHNTAYLEPHCGRALPRMILNLESGGFDRLAPNRWDTRLDAQSARPGQQRLEKMVAGRYLGALFSHALTDALELSAPPRCTTEDLSAILADNSPRLEATAALLRRSAPSLSAEAVVWSKALAETIAVRAARLTAATYAGILWHLDDAHVAPQQIAVDGTLYEKLPLYKEALRQALCEILGPEADRARVALVKDGSALGAAVAAAVAARA